MDFVRTPDERFANLVGWPYPANYVDVPAGDGSAVNLRMHHVDEGSGPPMLLLHGEPTWGYLYRKMIGPLVEAGFRVLVPDLVGFGRSDKPTRPERYTYQRHVDWLEAWFLELGLSDVTLFAQDWGGLLGLRLVANHPERFARVVVANTGLPTGDHPATEAFLNWQRFAATAQHFPIGKILQNSTVAKVPDDVLVAYEAPFPSDEFLVAARIFPALVPTNPDDPASGQNRAAWEVLERWDKPFLTAFADSDPITRGGDRPFQIRIPGAQDRHHPTIVGAGHFLQEDKGEELADILIGFAAET
ncbi:MAG: haloalkane dehalogenase [Acidimicrobiia bacterium]